MGRQLPRLFVIRQGGVLRKQMEARRNSIPTCALQHRVEDDRGAERSGSARGDSLALAHGGDEVEEAVHVC